MDILEKVKKTIDSHGMLSAGDRVLVGLSGGPDSVCLLRVLNELKPVYGIVLAAAYVDHGLRPSETPGEIDFCAKLCSSLDIAFSASHVKVAPFAKEEGLNKQEAARELRYRALLEAAAEFNANKIALGHNAVDQAETVLMRLFRGAGPLGISGIPPVRDRFIRPLIEIERSEIEDFLGAGEGAFIVDSSNLRGDYLRNRMRQTLIPAIQALDKNAIRAIGRSSDIFRDEERYFDVLVTKTLMRMISRKSEAGIELFLSPMETMDNALLRRVLRRAVGETRGLKGISLVHIGEIMDLVKSGKSGDRVSIPKGLRAVKGYATLIITSEAPAKLGAYMMNGPGEVVLKESSLVLHCVSIDDHDAPADRDPGDGRRIALLDAGKLRFPLLIRSRRPGDYFYPLGFGKRKKLQDFFVDEKVPRDRRDAVPLLVSNDDIAWVVGYRVDDRYKIDKSSGRVLKFEIKLLKF